MPPTRESCRQRSIERPDLLFELLTCPLVERPLQPVAQSFQPSPIQLAVAHLVQTQVTQPSGLERIVAALAPDEASCVA